MNAARGNEVESIALESRDVESVALESKAFIERGVSRLVYVSRRRFDGAQARGD